MENKYRVYNKIISTMQQRFETSQYYRYILQDSGNDIDKAIKGLIDTQTDRIEMLSNQVGSDLLQINMLISHIKELESLA